MPSRFTLVVLLLASLSSIATAEVMRTRYAIVPPSEVEYNFGYWGGFRYSCDGTVFGSCQFPTRGELTLVEDFESGEAYLEDVHLEFNADLFFSGVLSPYSLHKVEMHVSQVLDYLTFVPSESLVGGKAYETPNTYWGPLFLFTTNEGSLELTGGYDHTGFDGDGVDYRLQAVRIAEPSSAGVMGCLLAVSLGSYFIRSAGRQSVH